MLRDPWTVLIGALDTWHQGKLFVEHSLTISHDALHILVGTLLWIVFGLALRRPLYAWRAWRWLFAATFLNEAVDLWVEQWPDPGQQYGEGAKDVLLTMAVPTLIMLAARLRPDLFRMGTR